MRFCAPNRAHDFTTTPNTQNKTDPDVDVFTSMGEEMATDLAGDLVNYFMPTEQRWVEYEVTTPVPEEAVEQVASLVSAREDDLFDLLDSSNLNDIKPQIMFEAATHGTPALWVDQGHFQEPIHFEVVPPNELYVSIGHMGKLDRFRKKTVMAVHLEALLPEADLGHADIQKKMRDASKTSEVMWGYWIDWSDPANPMWKREITVDEHLVTPEGEVIGPLAGACPLLVGRFNPQPNRPWGRGPGLKALPDLLELDKIKEVLLDSLDQYLDPAWTYHDDGVLDMSGGIQPGMAYPRRSDQLPSPLLPGSNPDAGWFAERDIEERIRVAFYQDGPRQRGDTPPTASQWLDERRRVQQRLGKPSAPLWTELLQPIVQRAEWLGVQSGILQQAISLNGRAINLKALSPLQKAESQDKAMVSRANLDLMAQLVGPEGVMQAIDILGTYQGILKATGDDITKLNQQLTPPPDETA